MKAIDPAAMSFEERVAELGAIFATGAQRAVAKGFKRLDANQISQDRLDVIGQVEAPCRSATEASA